MKYKIDQNYNVWGELVFIAKFKEHLFWHCIHDYSYKGTYLYEFKSYDAALIAINIHKQTRKKTITYEVPN